MIFNPTKPPLANYVEVEDENGNRIYEYIGKASPTEEEKLEAQILYTALMTDTLLEESSDV